MTRPQCEESAENAHGIVQCGDHTRIYVACCGWSMCFEHGREHLLTCERVPSLAEENDGD